MQKEKEQEDADAAAKKLAASGDLEAKLARARQIKAARDAKDAKNDGSEDPTK